MIGTTGGTGDGQKRLITAYNGTTKVATVYPDWTVTPDVTTTYTVYKNALYTAANSALETVTMAKIEPHVDGASASKRRLITGAAGTYSLKVDTRKTATVDFDYRGISQAPDDIARGADPVYANSPVPLPFQDALAYLGGAAVKFGSMSFDQKATVDQCDDPAALYGYDIAEVMERAGSGKITPNKTLASSRDSWADWMAMTDRALWLCWGNTAGKRVSLYWPVIRYTGNESTDIRKVSAEGLPFRAESPLICLF